MHGKQPLVIILGAGASCALGLPSTAALTDKIVASLKTNKRVTSLVEHIDATLKLNIGDRKYNFEHFWDVMEFIESYCQAKARKGGHEMVEELFIKELDPQVAEFLNSSKDFVPYFGQDVQFKFFDTLRGELVEATASVRDHQNWKKYLNFLSKLQQEFSLFFVTLNYDLCLETAFEEITKRSGEAILLEDGFRDVEFSEKKDFSLPIFRKKLKNNTSMGNKNYHILMHLHGSLRQNDIQPTYHASQSGHSSFVRDGLVVGRRKPDKILMQEPYSAYYVDLMCALAEYPHVLVIGYGFSDMHVNSFLSRRGSLLRDQVYRTAYIIDVLNNDEFPQWCTSIPPGDIFETGSMIFGLNRQQSFRHALDLSGRKGEQTIQGEHYFCDFSGFLSDENQVESIIGFFKKTNIHGS